MHPDFLLQLSRLRIEEFSLQARRDTAIKESRRGSRNGYVRPQPATRVTVRCCPAGAV